MKIGVYQREGTPEDGGGHTFETAILKCLAERQSKHDFVSVVDSPTKSYLSQIVIPWHLARRLSSYCAGLLGRPAFLDLSGRLLQNGVRLLYSPGPWTPCLDIPYVVTCWDLQHRLQPWFPEVSAKRRFSGSEWDLRERHFSTIFPRASAIIVGTETGKAEILRFYRVAEERVRVIPFFASDALTNCEKSRPKWMPPGRFLFYPAQFWPHKNHIILIEALKQLHDGGLNDLHLVLAGSNKPKEYGTLSYLRSKALEFGVSEFVSTPGFLPNEEIRWLYENALALTFVSFFGPDNLPPLEAAALGCPVIAADVSGAREQLRDLPIYIDPGDSGSVTSAVKCLAESEDVRSARIRYGLSFVDGLTVDHYVDQLLELFVELTSLMNCWGASHT